MCEGCADPFSPKVVRSTMGAVFRLPCVQLPLADAVEQLREAGLAVYATALHADSMPLDTVPLERAAVIIGSEGRGVSQSALNPVSYTHLGMLASCEECSELGMLSKEISVFGRNYYDRHRRKRRER